MIARNRVYALFSLSVFAYAFVLIFANGADAHSSDTSKVERCSNGQLVMEVTWANDYDVPATITTSDGQKFKLAPFGKVTGVFLDTIKWTTRWEDGYKTTGTVEMDPAFEGCLLPIVTTSTTEVQATTSSTTTTTVPSTTTLGVIPRAPVVEAVSVDRIRFTG